MTIFLEHHQLIIKCNPDGIVGHAIKDSHSPVKKEKGASDECNYSAEDFCHGELSWRLCICLETSNCKPRAKVKNQLIWGGLWIIQNQFWINLRQILISRRKQTRQSRNVPPRWKRKIEDRVVWLQVTDLAITKTPSTQQSRAIDCILPLKTNLLQNRWSWGAFEKTAAEAQPLGTIPREWIYETSGESIARSRCRKQKIGAWLPWLVARRIGSVGCNAIHSFASINRSRQRPTLFFGKLTPSVGKTIPVSFIQ